jgi:hypothetical protein
MKTLTLVVNPDKKDVERKFLRDIDREDTIKLLVAFGLEPALVEGDDTKVVVWFVATEIEGFETRFISNKADMVVPVVRVIYSNDYWRTLMTLWKSKMKQAYAAE